MADSDDSSLPRSPRGSSNTLKDRINLAVVIFRFMKSAPEVDIAALAKDQGFSNTEAAHQAVNRALRCVTGQYMEAVDVSSSVDTSDTDNMEEEEEDDENWSMSVQTSSTMRRTRLNKAAEETVATEQAEAPKQAARVAKQYIEALHAKWVAADEPASQASSSA